MQNATRARRKEKDYWDQRKNYIKTWAIQHLIINSEVKLAGEAFVRGSNASRNSINCKARNLSDNGSGTFTVSGSKIFQNWLKWWSLSIPFLPTSAISSWLFVNWDSCQCRRMHRRRYEHATSDANTDAREKWQLPREAVEEDFAILQRERIERMWS